MLGTVFASAFAFQMYVPMRRESEENGKSLADKHIRTWDVSTTKFWDNMNRGVRERPPEYREGRLGS